MLTKKEYDIKALECIHNHHDLRDALDNIYSYVAPAIETVKDADALNDAYDTLASFLMGALLINIRQLDINVED